MPSQSGDDGSIPSRPAIFFEIKMTDQTRVETAQKIFNETLPVKNGAGLSVEIPFNLWREETRAYFLKLADMWLSKA